MDDYSLPKLKEPTEIPKIDKGVMAHSKPFCATPEHQSALGFPGELVEDWHDKAIAKFGEILNGQGALSVYMDACVKCGDEGRRESR